VSPKQHISADVVFNTKPGPKEGQDLANANASANANVDSTALAPAKVIGWLLPLLPSNAWTMLWPGMNPHIAILCLSEKGMTCVCVRESLRVCNQSLASTEIS
jgi:hypothetical protein